MVQYEATGSNMCLLASYEYGLVFARDSGIDACVVATFPQLRNNSHDALNIGARRISLDCFGVRQAPNTSEANLGSNVTG